MKETVWIINHYATGMMYSKGGRHYWFAKYLVRKGYKPVIFSCNTQHGIKKKWVETNDLWVEEYAKDINTPFVLIKSSLYDSNGKERILNMLHFYLNVKKAAKQYAKMHGKPDVIYASSVHPLTLVAGIKLAKHFGVRCICEVRDLWPLALVVFGRFKEYSAITKILYRFERWIYKKADHLIFTFNDGKQYIVDRGWNSMVDLSKVHYINNGIDFEGYEKKIKDYSFEDEDLDSDFFKIVYTGTIGPPNQINLIVDAAIQLKEMNEDGIRFIIYGDGISKEEEELRCRKNELRNIVFKGRVEKDKIPYILSKSNATIIMEKETKMNQYGTSENKVFDYLAAGKPIICNDECIRSIVGDSSCVSIDADIVNAIERVQKMTSSEYEEACKSAKEIGERFSFSLLTDQLIAILENETNVH